jgi:excisionase family DNA binding protein
MLPKNYITVTQAAKYIGVDRSRIRQMIKEGKLKSEKIKTTTNKQGFIYSVHKPSLTPYKKPQQLGRPRIPKAK